AGWEGTGVTAFREASTIAASALDYAAAERWIGEGGRYADSVEQSHCAHVMRSTEAMVSWAGADPVEAKRRARQAIVDKGCGRGTFMARWALGFVAMTRGDVHQASEVLTDALEVGATRGEIQILL